MQFRQKFKFITYLAGFSITLLLAQVLRSFSIKENIVITISVVVFFILEELIKRWVFSQMFSEEDIEYLMDLIERDMKEQVEKTNVSKDMMSEVKENVEKLERLMVKHEREHEEGHSEEESIKIENEIQQVKNELDLMDEKSKQLISENDRTESLIVSINYLL